MLKATMTPPTSRRSQPPLALAVPLSRFAPRVGGGSAFFVGAVCMFRWLTLILCMVAALCSVSWLVGYVRAIWPFVPDGIRDRDFAFLTYPNIKWFTEVDERTGKMSEMQIDWFSVCDGPTGIEYAHRYFPCWIVSLVAIAVLVASLVGILLRDRAVET